MTHTHDDPKEPPAPKKISVTVAVDAALLKRAVRAVVPAASTGGWRPAVEQLYVRVDPPQQTVRLVATDSYRMHALTLTASNELSIPTDGDVTDFAAPARWFKRWAAATFGKAATARLRFDQVPGDIGAVTIDVDGDGMSVPAFDDVNRIDFDAILNRPEATGGDPAAVVAYNPKFLAAALAAHATFDKDAPVRTVTLDLLKPTRLRSISHGSGGGVLDTIVMPVRVP